MGEEVGEREKWEERRSATTATTLHMNNKVRSVVPPRRQLLWQAGGSSSILVWKQRRVSTLPARGLHSLSGEPALSSAQFSLLLFLFFMQSILQVCM